MKAANRIENFRYRIRRGKVFLHDALSPSFAHLKPGDELFRMITVDFIDNFEEFDDRLRKAISTSEKYFDPSLLGGRDDFVFISALPWIRFSGVDHTLGLNKDDSIPRISWGKIHGADGTLLLPYNVQVNHRLVDGIHVARFLSILEKSCHDVTKFT